MAALDVVVQDQILRLLVRLSEELGLALLLVTHDLGVVAHMCERILVLDKGELVETLSRDELYRGAAKHAFTQSLLDAARKLGLTTREPT